MPPSVSASKKNLIVVSNRLPLSIKRVDDSFEANLSGGGLVTSLSGLTKSTSFRWFGWPGIEVKDENEEEKVANSLSEHNAVPIFIDEQLAHDHYNGFSNSTLWPILHYQSGVEFEDDNWQAYKRVNEIFADIIAKEATEDNMIWIHDYHLMLLPQLLRERLEKQGRSFAIGFSLHTPFPAEDFWKSLPVRNELVEGILASDLIGFHTEEYKHNFTTCAQTLGAFTEIQGEIQYKDRKIMADKFIVGIDPQKFTDALEDPDVRTRIQELQERYKGVKVILGVDRLDYIKGLTQKLKGYDYFLDHHPEISKKVVLIQVAVPSREDVKEYQDLETDICTTVGKINGKHATADGTPLIYIHRSVSFTELTALYSLADACLLTSTRDGMNLVSFEYIACQAQRHGVLVLSEFAGAASFLKEGSISFHPANIPEMSDAIHEAVSMSSENRKRRYEGLREFIETNTSTKWGETFIEKLSERLQST
ncbi:hypothetical protein N8T08_002061 [Aspergillus melleus]|uniref:Uncharacterized protein n=1 Tax=Aspergillus melleus TaxID=138277 RepID=A0ACC3AMG6_9EURO|nr:hypothetical protein N8T08_002061 [Aspergillus melleus]